MNIALSGGKVITPFRILNDGIIVIEDGKITNLGKSSEIKIPKDCETIDIKGKTVCPGFVDLLDHGGAGYGFADDSVESIEKISRYLLEHGLTTVLASLYAKPEKLLLKDLRRISDYIIEHPDSNIHGIHVEGPYLNNEGRYEWKLFMEAVCGIME
jgi:N-acetylglucosamine-6-phosphate deacetylase